MLRFIPGLAKLPEKRKITQTEKRQRGCVYDRSNRINRGYIKEWENEYAWLAYDDEKNAMFFLFDFVKAGLVKSLAD